MGEKGNGELGGGGGGGERFCAYIHLRFITNPFCLVLFKCRCRRNIQHVYTSQLSQTTPVPNDFHSRQQALLNKNQTHPTHPQLKALSSKQLFRNTKHSLHHQEKSVHMANTTFTPSSTVPNRIMRVKMAPRSCGSGTDERKESSMKAWQMYCPSSA